MCVPGMGDLRAEYRFLRPRLVDAGFRVVCMDLRGTGESSVTFVDWTSYIVALVRHLGGGPATVIGTSLAAASAAWAALEAPELIDRLVLIGAFVRATSRTPGPRRNGSRLSSPRRSCWSRAPGTTRTPRCPNG
jgi:pimeloyl-ACP methyl ester carboxylesterase